MSSSDVKIGKSKLLQKYTYIKTTPYTIEKTKFIQSLQSEQKKILVNTWTVDCYLFILHTRSNYKKDEMEQESLWICLNNAASGSFISADQASNDANIKTVC